MADLGIHTHHFRMIERGDKAEHSAGCRQIDIAAWLIRRLRHEFVVIALVDGILAKEIHGLALPLQRFPGVLGGIDFGAFASAPEDVDVRPEFGSQIHRTHRFLNRIEAHPRVVRSESAVFENRIVEKIRGGHRHFHAGVGQRLFELADNPISIGRRSIDRDQIVVVQVHAISAEFAQTPDHDKRT